MGKKEGTEIFFPCKWSGLQGHMGLKSIRIATGEKPGNLLLLGKMEISSMGGLEITIIRNIKLLVLIIIKTTLPKVDSCFLKLIG